MASDIIPALSLEAALWTVVVLVCTLLLAMIIERHWHMGKLQRLGYTGPRPNLLLGTLREFTKVSGEFPYGWQRIFDAYGSQVGDVKGKCLAMYMGRLPCVIVTDPDVIQTIAIRHFDNFRNRMFCEVGKNRGVIAARDQAWKNARHTLAPAFSQAKMKHMSHAMNKSLSLTFDIIEEHIADDKPVDVLRVFRGLTMEVICKCGLGLEVNAQRKRQHPLLLSAIKIFEDYGYDNMKRLLITLFPKFTTTVINFFDLGFTPSETAVLECVKKVIHERMMSPQTGKTLDALHFMMEAAQLIATEDSEAASPATNGHACTNGNGIAKSAWFVQQQDVASNGLKDGGLTNGKHAEQAKTKKPKLTTDEVAANAFLLLLAGYETTSAALAFTSYLLAKNPHVQQRLYEEISEHVENEDDLTYDMVGQLQYLDMVINESLRCYPPAGNVVTREVDKDFEYRGLKFPAKSYVLLPIAYTHYNPDLWDDPMTFDPERFHPDRKKDIHPAAFMPFGLGPRQCMGTRFALMEAKLAVSRLVMRFRLDVCPLTEMNLKTRASILILSPASGKLYLRCYKRKD
ncbi:cytochrome P450 3A6-like [Macrobrachium nipponense]|uniref:cytochrome P450 3A6-like n=1 Tax=Macrobrachium nipponense TaxID=159736 RepID=UPI0030C7EA22